MSLLLFCFFFVLLKRLQNESHHVLFNLFISAILQRKTFFLLQNTIKLVGSIEIMDSPKLPSVIGAVGGGDAVVVVNLFS